MEENRTEKKEIRLSLSGRLLNTIFSIAALILLALLKILINFGVMSNVLNGIFAIIIYALSIIGVIWSLLREKGFSVEFAFNLVVLIIALGIAGI